MTRTPTSDDTSCKRTVFSTQESVQFLYAGKCTVFSMQVSTSAITVSPMTSHAAFMCSQTLVWC